MQTKHLRITAKAPGPRGTFDGTIVSDPPEGDHDHERIASWNNLPTTVPLIYSHVGGDPGAIVGKIDVRPTAGGRLFVSGQLDIKVNPMAVAVHERMMLPADDEMALNELSVGFEYDPAKNTKDANGVTAIHDAKLLEVSIVRRGAQTTSITNVKAGARNSAADLALVQSIHDAAMELGATCPGYAGAQRSASEHDHDLDWELTLMEREIDTKLKLSKLERSLTIEGRVEQLARDTRVDQELRDLESELRTVQDRRAKIDADVRREVFGPPKTIVTAVSSDPAGRSREAAGQVPT
jgi:hypothetical protein